MKRIKSRLLAMLMLMAMVITSMFTVAFAGEDTVNIEDYVSSKSIVNSAGATFTDAQLNKYLTFNESEKNPESGEYTIRSGDKTASVYLKKGVTEEDLVAGINKMIAGAEAVDSVSNITDGLGISADTAGATALLSGFAPIFSLVIGILTVLITIGMTLFSAFDMFYIAFPVFRNKCEEAKMQGQGAMVKRDGNGESSLRFITDDAQYAVSQGTIESGKSPWAIYFRKRIMSYILLSIILFILLTGNINLITDIALKVVSGIMNVLSGLT